ncbi:MAG: isocitrate lyase/PEP mutase family protein [Myxococcales bacterium]|nr:isocitrate lyase/PEP mutase family protein [Myxococcales bacterium]
MNKTGRLQELFQRDEIFSIGGAASAIYAKIVELAGYECVYMGGGLTSAFEFGIPDAGTITVTELVDRARVMSGATEIPLISDADQGFGNAVAVRRTVHSFIRAGVAGIHIEDQVYPKPCAEKRVLPVEEAVEKYRAAVDAKRELDADFVLIARCDARGAEGGSLEAAIDRLKAYKKTGVDVLWLEPLHDREEVRTLRAELDGPLMGTHFFDPPAELSEIADLGFSAGYFPMLTPLPALEAAWEYAHDLRERGVAAQLEYEQRPRKYPMPAFFDLVGLQEALELEAKHTPPKREGR